MTLWVRIWTRDDDRQAFFNPYILSILKIANAVVNFLRPVFYGVPPRAIAAISLAFLVVFRGFLTPETPPWLLLFGLEIWQPFDSTIPASVLFSALSLAIFLFNIWAISLIYIRPSGTVHSPRTQEAFRCLSRPFTNIRLDWRPVVLLLYGILITFLLDRYGIPRGQGMETAPGDAIALPLILARFSVSVMAAWANVLPILAQSVFFLIIGLWVSQLIGSQNTFQFCREWMDAILGRWRRHAVRIGPIDLTPLLFMVGIVFLYVFLFMILKGWQTHLT